MSPLPVALRNNRRPKQPENPIPTSDAAPQTLCFSGPPEGQSAARHTWWGSGSVLASAFQPNRFHLRTFAPRRRSRGLRPWRGTSLETSGGDSGLPPLAGALPRPCTPAFLHVNPSRRTRPFSPCSHRLPPRQHESQGTPGCSVDSGEISPSTMAPLFLGPQQLSCCHVTSTPPAPSPGRWGPGGRMARSGWGPSPALSGELSPGLSPAGGRGRPASGVAGGPSPTSHPEDGSRAAQRQAGELTADTLWEAGEILPGFLTFSPVPPEATPHSTTSSKRSS